MTRFDYVTPRRLEEVPELLADGKGALLAGGTDLLDRLKEHTAQPERVVNIKGLTELRGLKTGKSLRLGALAATVGRSLRLGALTTIADIARDDDIARTHTVLAEAAAAVGTPQLRNMGTLGGNLCQRPRCWYFRGRDYDCLKKGGSVCFAVDGLNKYHAIFGSGPCHIVHPSDTAPALVALQAELEIHGKDGERRVQVERFFRLPQDRLGAETGLAPDELVTQIHVPAAPRGTRSTYLKHAEKQSQDFALTSVAAVLHLDGDRVAEARIVLGWVAPVPWRVPQAEAQLRGHALSANTVDAAAEAAVAAVEPMRDNSFKVTLARHLVRRALQRLAG